MNGVGESWLEITLNNAILRHHSQIVTFLWKLVIGKSSHMRLRAIRDRVTISIDKLFMQQHSVKQGEG